MVIYDYHIRCTNFSYWRKYIFLLTLILICLRSVGATVNQSDFDQFGQYYKKRQFKQAFQELDRLEKEIRLSPDTALLFDVYYRRGRVFQTSKKFELAIESYTRATTHPKFSTTSKNSIKVLYRRGFCYYQIHQFDRCIEDMFSVIHCHNEIEEPDPYYPVNAYIILGSIAKKQSRYQDAKQYYERALKLDATFRQEMTGMIFNNLAQVYGETKEFDAAINVQLRALAFFKVKNDSTSVALANTNIGIILGQNNNLEKAASYFERAMKYLKNENKGQDIRALAYSWLGTVYSQNEQLEIAKIYYDSSLVISRHLPDKINLARNLNRAGNFYFHNGHQKKALILYQEALDIYSEFKIEHKICLGHYNVGMTYYKLQQIEQAKEQLETATEQAKVNYYADILSNSYRLLSDIAQLEKDYPLALSYANLFSSIQDTIKRKSNVAEVANSVSIYEKQASELLLAQAKIDQLQLSEKAQRNYILFGILIIILMAIGIFGYYRRNRQLKETNSELQRSTAILRKAKGILGTEKKDSNAEELSPLRALISEVESLEKIIQQDQPSSNRQNRHLIEQVEQLKMYLFTLAHDLQLPIYQIKDQLESVISTLDSNKELNKTALGDTLEATTNLQKLLHSFLDSKRIDESELFYSEISTEEIIETLQDKLNLDHHILDYKNLPIVKADALLLKQVFQNLIDNAIKFTKEVDTPIINITAEKRGSFHQFKVIDNGIGINVSSIESIFEPYVKNKNHKRKGYGIGLHLVKRIIEKHKGSVAARENPKGGTIIEFHLPIVQ